MAQHDYVIDNQTAPNFRADLNNALSAIVSTNSGASAPSTTYANMLWYDTTNDILKMRNEANSGWINIGTLNQSTGQFEVANLTTLTQADWEAGIVTTEALVSPAKIKAAVESFVPIYEDGEDATTSGTSHDFTSIPAGINEIEIHYWGISLNGTDDLLFQIGTSGTPATTGYVSQSTTYTATRTATNGFVVVVSGAGNTVTGKMVLSRVPGTNKWFSVHNGNINTNVFSAGQGSVTLAGALGIIRLTRIAAAGTYPGTNTFDAGGWSIRCRK